MKFKIGDHVIHNKTHVHGTIVDNKTWADVYLILWDNGIIPKTAYESELELAKPKLDLTQPVQTRDGQAVRILYTDAPGDYPVIGYFINNANRPIPLAWTTGGQWYSDATYDHKHDLVQAKTKHERWANIYPKNQCGCMHPDKPTADLAASPDRIACVKIEF